MTANQDDFYTSVGMELYKMGEIEPAITAYGIALAHDPGRSDTFVNLGVALEAAGRPSAAAACYRQAVAVEPMNAVALHNLGLVLLGQGQVEEALPYLRRATTANPTLPQSHVESGNALMAMSRTEEAILAYRRAVDLAPDMPEYRFNLALALLANGRLKEGFQEYEWRRRIDKYRRDVPAPEWDGEPLRGRTIVLHAEQGFGDALQFARYAPLVAAKGGRVILWVHRALVRLLATVPGVTAAVASQPPHSAFDVHAPLMSLPHLFGTELDTVPGDVPYIFPDPDAAAAWEERLAGLPGLKIGLVWAGNPRLHDRDAAEIDRHRSLRLEQFAPLAAISGVTFVSLQKGDSTGQAKAPPAGLRLVDWMDEVTDFADTAALVANLDLVISVDTSVVHLAGAMGKPVWILSRFDGCWRWLENRDDSPWYPTARLFRQPAPGQWEPVLIKVADALRKQVAAP